uniref:enoyl-CoA hydratase n=1 Tax=Panagrolaimus superbus TaxID=310955 RepID=A0A914Y073_9BILA
MDFRKLTTFIQNNDSIKGVVIMSGKLNSFIAGADIKLLDTFKDASEAEKYVRDAQNILLELEKSEKPIIAAIMGTCFGGGLELTVACHYRIAVNDRKTLFALPEVMLGLLPGAGGTQRLPQLISLTTALDLILTGKSIKSEKAKLIGLIDEIVEPCDSEAAVTHQELENVAVERAKQILDGTFTIQRSRSLTERITNFFLCRWPFLDMVVLRAATNTILEETYGNYPAPMKILEAIRIGLIEGNAAGYEFEAKSFAELLGTSEAKALIGIFNASTECKKDKYGDVKKIE